VAVVVVAGERARKVPVQRQHVQVELQVVVVDAHGLGEALRQVVAGLGAEVVGLPVQQVVPAGVAEHQVDIAPQIPGDGGQRGRLVVTGQRRQVRGGHQPERQPELQLRDPVRSADVRQPQAVGQRRGQHPLQPAGDPGTPGRAVR